MRLLPVLLLFGVLGAALAKKPVTIDTVTSRDPERAFAAVWAPDGKSFVWRAASKIRIYEIAKRSERELLDTTALTEASVEVPRPEKFGWVNRGVQERELQWFPSSRQLLLRLKGDLFVYDLGEARSRQLTKTPQVENDPRISPDGRSVSFRLEHDLYVIQVDTGKTRRLTSDGSPNLLNAELDWVYPEELALATAHWWSPDSTRIAYLQFDISRQMVYPHADLLGLRPVEEPQRYPQAGTPNAVVRLGVVAASGGPTKWVETGASPESLTARVTWMRDSARLAVHLLSRVQDRLDLVIAAIGGKPKTFLSEKVNTWINLRDDFQFLAEGRLIWGSEAGGWRHLSLRNADGRLDRWLTRGDWEVTDLGCVDEKTKRVFFSSTDPSPVERQFYSVGFDGGEPVRLTKESGNHTVSMAPDCGHYIDSHSSLTEPEQRTVYSSAGEPMAVLTKRNTSQQEEYELVAPELLTFRGKEGTLFHARLTRPVGFDPSKKYPAIVMVYGGPHSQTVRNFWRGADWDQALAHRGYVVWQMDNRGAAGRGHLWEAPLYRRFGARELADQLEGVRHLSSLGFVDPARIGIYGWSYGGFMTLYSMLNSPDTFRAGIAGAPVTDWRNYDTIYTERYLGLPSQNEEGYKLSSPVFKAAQLNGALMLAHNFEDDNVLFQHTMRMIDALQKEGKHFDLLLYPQKTHGVSGSALRKNMLEAMTAFFDRNLK